MILCDWCMKEIDTVRITRSCNVCKQEFCGPKCRKGHEFVRHNMHRDDPQFSPRWA